MQKDLKRIKDKYGEKFSHLCRELFPTILEMEGLLPSLLESNFYPSKFLYYDIINNELVSAFQIFINTLVKKNDIVKVNTNKTPYELLDEAGYTLYECKTDADIQSFKKYYEQGEQLCTFRDKRLETNYVFFAVKKNVSDIKREDFSNPERQDEYGTSVISIQFTKGTSNYVSIKNRYNHIVINPDSTFGNNLDNIITGLTQSFKQEYSLNICNEVNGDFEIPNYIKANDGRFYKYNYEINNIYYCSDNIIIDNFKLKKFEKDRYIIFDYFILDMKEKKISLYDERIKDNFMYCNKNIEKVEIKKEKDEKYILLKKSNHQIIIALDNENKMISYHNNLVLKIGDSFLSYNQYLDSIYLDNVIQINDSFMKNNRYLNHIYMPLLAKTGDDFLTYNTNLEEFSFPNLEYIGNNFLYWNCSVRNIDLPIVKEVGHNFMYLGGQIEYLVFPNLIKTGGNFLSGNSKISFFSAPELEEAGDNFLRNNCCLTFLELEKLKRFGFRFLNNNVILEELRLQSLQIIGKPYLEGNCFLSKLVIPEDIFNEFIQNTSFEGNFESKQKKLIL